MELLGFTSIALVSLITIFLALRYPDVSKILLVALFIRVVVMLLGHYFITLPDSTADARTFESIAWTHSLHNASHEAHPNFFSLLEWYNGPQAHFITFFLSIPYYFLGRSILMAQSISLLFGIGSVFLGWKISKIIWDNRVAKKIGWMIALFPSLILYSVLTMKEVYVSFFLLIALYGIVRWVKTNSLISFLITLAGFTGGIFFHGSLIVGAIFFVLIVGIRNLKNIFISLSKGHVNLKILIFLIIFSGLAASYLSNKIGVPYLGNFERSTDLDRVLHKTTVNTRGEASWPDWLKVYSPIEATYKVPVRAIYFIFSPFPWDVKKNSHLIGMFDALIYLYLVYLIFCNRKIIWKDPTLKTILILLLIFICVYAVGVGNFGTGIRHRSKFTIMFILLAGPMLKKFIFFKKNDKV
jgi:hypothetical protein